MRSRSQILALLPALLLALAAIPVQGQGTSPKKLTLAWDTSLSMENNKPVYALRYLETVFAANPDCQVRMLAFSSEVQEQAFQVRGGDWSALKAYLEKLTYDGAAVYGILAASLDGGETYLYTDGKQVLPAERLPVEKGYTVLSRATGPQQQFLERSSLLYRGHYVQLTPYTAAEEGPQPQPSAAADARQGRIYIDNQPAPGLFVQRLGDSEAWITDAEGRFSLTTKPGDTLLISGGSFAMPQSRVVPADATFDLFLDSRVIALDEVEVSKVRANNNSGEAENIGYGETDKNRLGVAVQSIDDDQITDVNTDVSKAMQGRFSGVNMGQEADLSKVTMRTMNSMLLNNFGLIVIDGIPMEQADSSKFNNSPQNPVFNFVDPQNIAKITVLKGLAATNKYGTLGANGVVMITTKNAAANTDQAGEGMVDRARLRNNTYTGEGLSTGTASAIQAALKGAPAGSAYQKYLELRGANGNRPAFFLEAYEFFKTANPALAARIATNLLEGAPENPLALETVLHFLAELEQPELIGPVSESLASLQPDRATPLLYQAAITPDKRILNELLRKLILLKNGLDTSTPFKQAYADYLEKEIRHLVFARRFELDKNLYPDKYHTCPTYKARLVFEWNLPGAEFVLQSVNPQKKFYAWEHSNAADPGLIREELQTGVKFKDFDLYGPDSPGEWLFNVEFLDGGPDGDQLPFTIGCRIYENFGTAHETSRYVTLHLSEPGQKQNLVTLHVN